MSFERHPPVRPRSYRFLRFSIIFSWTVAGLLVGKELFDPSYDGDIDHEMYFGHELLSGRLIWASEFHDKLPLVQYFFAIVDLLGGVWVWRVFSLTAILLVSIYVSRVLASDLDFLKDTRVGKWLATQHIAPLTLLITALLPKGFTHINAFAAEAALLSIFLLRDCRTAIGSRRFVVLLIAASLSGVVAISFRPYFFPPLLLALFLIAFVIPQHKVRTPKTNAFAFFSVTVLAVATLGVLTNLFPYFLSGKLAVAIDGLRILLAINNPVSTADSLREQLQDGWLRAGFTLGVVTVALIAVGVFINSLYLKKAPSIVFTVVPAIIFALFATLLFQHWWPHYANLFSPFLGVMLPYLLARNFSRVPKLRSLGWEAIPLTRISRKTAGFIGGVLVGGLLTWMQTPDSLLAANNTFVKELTRIESLEGSVPRFVVPEDMVPHNEFNESRHGLPHAANTQQILDGWFSEVEPSGSVYIPNSLETYCTLLLGANIELVLLSEESELNRCFDHQGGRELLSWTEAKSASGLRVYRR